MARLLAVALVAAALLAAFEVARETGWLPGRGLAISFAYAFLASVLTGGTAWVLLRPVRKHASAETIPAARTAGSDSARPLLRVASRLAGTADLATILTAAVEETAAAVNCAAAIFLEDSGRNRLTLAAMHGLPEAVRQHWPATSRTRIESLFRHERVIAVPEVATSEVPHCEVYSALGVRSLVLVRLCSRTGTIGMMAVMMLDEPREFTSEQIQVLYGIADQTTQAVANSWLLARAERRLSLTQALRNIDIAIAGSTDLRVTLGVILEEVSRQLGVDAATVLLLEPRSQSLTFAAGRGFRSGLIEQTRQRLGEGKPGRAASERRVISVPNLREPILETQRAALLEAEQFVAYHGLPLIAKGQVKGVLEVFHRDVLDTDAEWFECAEALAGQTAIAIDSSLLFDELQRANLGLLLAYDSTLEGWSRALDLRDRETEGHTRRVTELTMRLAEAMGGVNAENLQHIRRGAMLHDIGKMGIPDNILLKPGPLNDEEWTVMRRHPALAYELLSPIAYLGPALEIPYCHHEKWDGSGYPRGLRGDQIPLAARIFAVADVWDALRSDRPYRQAWSRDHARDHIESLAGTHFDPRVVDLFHRVHDA